MKRIIAVLEEPRRICGPTTVRADATLQGLVRGAVYSFRVRTVSKEGVSGWSQVVSRLVA